MKNLSFQLTIPRFILWAAIVFLALPARADVPVITSEPTNVTAAQGSTVSFTVVATGATTYKWHKLSAGSATIGTQATLTLANIADSDADTYTVVVGNGSGSVTSSPAVLTVTHPPVVTSQPSGLVVNTGDEADFDVNVNGATPFSYQWQSNGIALASETDSSLSLNPTLDSFAAAYSVVITNSDGSSNSANALLSVVEPALVGTPSLAANSCATVALSVSVYGSDPSLQYQWYFGTNMTPVGTNGPILSLTNISFANAGVYSVTVSNPAGFGSSATATNTLTVQDPPPVVLTRNLTVQLDASGNASITPAQVDNGSYDNCAITNESVSPNTFTCLNVGTNTVTLYVTDNSNQLSSATALVTVQDVTPPTPVFNTISVQLDGTGNYTLTSADDNAITAGSSDNCGIASTNITPSSFTFCDVGAKSVTLTLTDVHGNTITTNGVINVLAPVAAPAAVYVDASYSGCGPVTFPNVNGTGSHFIGYDAFATIQGGVNAVALGGTVNVAAGTYTESVSANKSVTLLGANQGMAGCGSRGAESIINSGAGSAITVGASNVVIDGFNLTGVQGVQAVGYAAVIRNNVIGAAAAGVNAESITTTATNLVVENNCITLSAQVTGGTPTFGVLLVGVGGTQSPIIQDNGIQGAFYGYLLYGLNASVPTAVQGGTITGAMQGVAVVNLNPVTLSSYSPSSFRLDGLSLSGFTGNWPSLPNNNIHAGVYVYSGGSSPSAEVTGTLTNLTITGTDNLSPDSAGLDFADFSTGAGTRQQITVQNSVISTNSNRGIFVSGTNAVANVSGCSLIDNGFNPYGSGGNSGFGVIIRNNSQVTVSQCFIANPAAQTSFTVTAVESDANTTPLGPTLIVTGCSIVNNGNGNLAGQDAGTLNASGNWWGSTSDTAIASLMTGVVDFTPYLDSGTDTDNITPGFQGDFSTLHVTTFGAQTTGERVQEGHDLATGASPTVIVQAGNYSESVAISKSGFTLKSAQNVGVDARGARNAESIMSSTAMGGTIQISANNVTIDGMQTAGPGAVYGVNVSASAANAAVINTIMSGGGVGAGVFGTATLRYDVASVPANTVGILASGGPAAALVEYNSLTGDTEAGIKATLGAIVDAGDCAGGNVTRLGTGSGLNGSSAGGNSLTGYGFDNIAPWAVENLNPGGTPAVLAYQDNYGAMAGNLLASLFTGSVLADQAGALLLVSPTNLAFQCLSSVPPGAADLPGFMAQGGVASTTAATVSFNDSVASNNPNNLVITRTYTVTDACNQANCVQTITVDDTIPPTVVTKAVTITLDSTGNGSITLADVFNAALSSDNCSTVTPVSVSRSTFTFCDVGTTNVIVTAMDSSGNIGSNTAAVTIKPPVGSPAVVYVDTNYTGGCAVPFPFNGGSGAYFVGYNAFPTIQAGLNAVATKGTVNVAPGAYNENPVVNQPVTITSVGGNSASTTIINIQPANFAGVSGGFTINSSCVTIEGFTIVGLDAGDTYSSPTYGTASVNILLTAPTLPAAQYTNIEIANNIIEVGAIGPNYTGSDGFGFETTWNIPGGSVPGGAWPPGTSPSVSLAGNINIHNNVFQPVDVPPAYDTPGNPFFINPAGNFTFESNTITGDFGNSTTEATNSLIAYNVIIGTSTNDSSGGIATWGYPDPAIYGQATIIDNVISNTAYAILVYDSENVTIASNLLNGDGVGISVLDSGYDPVYPAGSTVQILDNSLANDAAGISNTSSNSTPVAVGNWWGDISGPSSVALNYYGTGSSVSSNLTFVPWLNSGGNTITNGFAPATPAPAYPPVQLVFTTQPGGADLGSPLSSQPVVQLEDTNGNVTPWANPIVTNILGNDLTGAILLGTTNEPAAAGVAAFTDLYVTIAGGSNLTLVASAPALPSATSSAFNITNPVPTISSVNPFFARAGGSNFTLTVSGSGFVGDSVVYWNGIALMTTYVSPTELTAVVPGSDIASVGPNTVTVGSPGPGGGATAPVNFSVDVASPPVVYVDHNYTGVATNTLVNWPYDTNSGPHIIGYDAFATVQGGVNGVAVSGTVNVAAGRYVEEVTIGQPLTLLGPNATNNPNICTRVAEAVIQPDYNDPEIYDANAVEIVSLESSNITVKGFTIDGYNPDLSGAFTSGTNFFNAAIGIGDYNGDSSIRIENNIVKNDSYVGVDLESDGPESLPNTNSCIKGNLIENMDYNTEGFGFGIILAQNYYAEIADNSLQNVAIGISPQNFNQANPGDVKGQTIRSNNVSASLLGIWLNLVYSSASTFNISDNTSSYAPTNGSVLYGPPGPPEWDAIEITSIQSAASVVASNNVITGPGANVGYNTVGYNIWNTPTTGSVAIIGGSVSNANYGVWVNNYDGYQSRGGSTTVTVNGVNISGATLAGVYVQDDPRASTNGVLVRATVNGNTVISNSTLGVLVQGTNAGASVLNNNASITGNTVGVAVDTGVALLQNNDLTGNSVAGISATNGAIVDAGDCAGGNVTGLGTGSGAHGSSAGGNNLSYGFGGAPWAILNVSGCTILAEQDNFGATMPINIAAAFNDPSTAIVYSQLPAVIAAPAGVSVTCDGSVPPPVHNLSAFIGQGGYVSVGPASYWQSNLTVTPSDTVYPVVGNGTDIRTYTIVDSCNTYTVAQTNAVLNTNLPVFTSTPPNVLQGTVSPSCTATVSITPATATGYCDGADGQPTVTVTAARSDLDPNVNDPYSIGLTTIIWTARDIYGNQNTYTQTVTVQDTTPPMVGTWPANQNLYVGGTCEAAIPDLTSQVRVTSSCNGVNITQIPPANTMVSVGMTNVTVVVTAADNPNNSVSNIVVLNVIDTNPPTATYVDTGYTGLASGAIVTWPAVGGNGTHYIGCDAFPTIQAGINRVATNGTVNVTAGTYPEVLLANKSLTLLGAQAGQNAGTRFAAFTAGANGPKADPSVESVITAAATAPGSATNDSVHIMANSVTMDGFVVDGNNPGLPQGDATVVGVINTDSRRAIETEDASGNLFSANSVSIKNNIIQNYAQRGVELSNPTDTSPATSGSLITGNVIGNYGLDGILLAYNAYSDVTSNTVIMAVGGESGIWQQDSGNPGTGAAPANINWSYNTVTVCQDAYAGIWVNLFHSSATIISIHDNTVSAANGVTGADDLTYGIYLTSVEGSTTPNLTNNIVGASGGQFARGIALWNLPTTTNTTVSGGTVGNSLIGVSLSYDDENFNGAGASFAANLTGVGISGTGIGVLVDATDSGANTVQMQISGNTTINACATGISVLGTKASANIHDNSASITGNGVGAAVDTGVALLQNNDLTGNSVAGISVTNGAIVDAGNCTGANVTGLGISTGGNNLSYGFAGSPWAIINGNTGGSPTVLADHDNFGAVVGNNIPGAFSGNVEYSQSPAVIGAPTNLNVVCASDVPAGVTSLADYLALGGYYSASAAASISSSDDTNFLGSGVIHRTYTVTDGCGVASMAVQTITVSDTIPPYFTLVPTNITVPVNPGQTNATDVTWVVTAGDNCLVQSVVSIPPSGSTFPVGVTTVTVVATDTSGNQTITNFTVLVVGLPQITQQPVSRTNNAGSTATFTVVATSPTQLSYLWKKNGVGLSDTGNISGSGTATLTVADVSDPDVASYSVCVSNLGGKVISSPATLTVIDPPVIVSITPASQTNNASTTATFSVSTTGTTPFTYQWTKITTNATNVLMDGGNILGSTSNVLTISNLLATDQAEYEVAVSNPAGSPSTNGTLFVIDPAILVQPVGVTTNQGGNATFTVIAAGTAPLSYQWQQDDVDLPGQTGSSLTVNDAQDSDEGGYTVVVSNSVGEITSASATLTLTHPPVIVTQPASRTNNLGTTATFTVSVDGATPFTYQWEKNGINISGATNITLVLSSVSSNDAANYQVAITNSNGYIISAAATLTVIVPPAITSQPVGLTNNAGTTASFSATASGTSPAYQWYEVTATATNALSDSNNISGSLSNVLTISNVLGADDASYYLLASNQAGVAVSSNAILAVIDPIITNEPANMTVNLGSPASFSVGAYGTSPQYQWYKNGTNIGGANASTYTIAAAADSDQASYTVIVTNIYGAVTSAPPATLTVIDPPVITGQPLSLTNNAGTTATFSVTATGTSPTYQWYYGLLPIGGANSATLLLTNVQDGNAGSYSVVLSNAAGVVTSTSATLTVIDAPAITGQPVSQTNNAGTTAMFSVTATGTSPTYQWYYGLLPIGGANSATLILTNVQDGNAGSYSVVLSNAAGVATSTSATLTVIDAPVITGQPMSRTNNAGTTATFSVTATGTSPSYQWYQGATPIGGANSATLSLLNVQDTNAGSYSVVLSNAAGVVTSASATLTVIDAPLITGQPSSVTNNASTTATFSVTNTGTPPLVYQWYKITLTSTNALSDTNNISGSASNVLTIANVLAADEASYSVTITNAAGTAVSSNAVLVVIDPVILVQPVGSTNFDGSTVTFSVTAAGTTTLSYQWYQDNVALYGDTNSSLTLANLADDDAGTYTVVVSNSVGSVISSPAVLLTIAPLITSQPSNVTVVQGGSANFSVSVDGETPFQYQWLFNGTNFSGATNRIFALSNVQTNNGGNYQVIVSDPIGVQTSLVATLTVVVPPAITAQPTNLIALAGQTASFNVTATGMPLVYQWYLNSTNLPFATNATLTLNNVTTNNSGTYFVTVTNLGGSVTSSNVTLAVYTTAAPELTLVLYTNSQATLELVGVPTYNYSIQSSSNFLEWVPLVTNASPFTFTDTNQAGHRFYRGRYVP